MAAYCVDYGSAVQSGYRQLTGQRRQREINKVKQQQRRQGQTAVPYRKEGAVQKHANAKGGSGAQQKRNADFQQRLQQQNAPEISFLQPHRPQKAPKASAPVDLQVAVQRHGEQGKHRQCRAADGAELRFLRSTFSSRYMVSHTRTVYDLMRDPYIG